jgi:hypothetical protein
LDTVDETEADPMNRRWLCQFFEEVPESQPFTEKLLPVRIGFQPAKHKPITVKLRDVFFIGGAEPYSLPTKILNRLARWLPAHDLELELPLRIEKAITVQSGFENGTK